MRRRDLLRLRPGRATRVAELSCERLYMRADDPPAAPAPVDAAELSVEAIAPPPPARSADEWFGHLDRALRHVDRLRVVDTEWLAAGPGRRDLEARLAAFRRRGGRVEFEPAG